MSARKRINLMPPEMRPALPQKVDKLLQLAALGTLILVAGLSISNAYRSTRVDREAQALTQKNGQIDAQLAVVQALIAKMSQRKVELKPLLNVSQKKVLWADAFKEMAALVSKGTWIESLQSVAGSTAPELVINGLTSSPTRIPEFVSELEQSYYFRNTMLKFTQRKKDVSPTLYEFQLQSKIKSEDAQLAEK